MAPPVQAPATLLRPATASELLDVAGVTVDQHAIWGARAPIAAGHLWIADTSQIWAADAWLYFAFVLDCHSARCLGLTTHRVLHADLVIAAIKNAVDRHVSAATVSPNGAQQRSSNRDCTLVSANGHDQQSPGDPAGREPALVLSRRCLAAGLDFPSWAIPSARDLAKAELFIKALRIAIVEEHEDEGWRSHGEARAALHHWVDHHYDPTGSDRPIKRRFAPRGPRGAGNGRRVAS